MIAGPVWLIGCGNMGGAMLRGWLASGLAAQDVTVIDPALPRLPEGVNVLPAVPVGAAPPVLLLLAIKPQMLGDVAPLVAPALSAGTLVMSILAGVEVANLRQALPAAGEIIRVMPNTPASIGKGISVVFAPGASQAMRASIDALLTPLGAVEWIGNEDLFHAVTALSGSGPAFVFRFVEALAKGGTALGLSADQALRLAIATVEGAAALAGQADEAPATLAARVTSPNGTTAAGLAVLDDGAAFQAIITATLAAAAKRSEELAAAAR